jgi:hypothetical protein
VKQKSVTKRKILYNSTHLSPRVDKFIDTEGGIDYQKLEGRKNRE